MDRLLKMLPVYLRRQWFPSSVDDLQVFFDSHSKIEIESALDQLTDEGILHSTRHPMRGCMVWAPANRDFNF